MEVSAWIPKASRWNGARLALHHLKDTKERTGEDGMKEEERARGCVVVNGDTEEIFVLIRNLQDGDGHRTVSDGG